MNIEQECCTVPRPLQLLRKYKVARRYRKTESSYVGLPGIYILINYTEARQHYVP